MRLVLFQPEIATNVGAAIRIAACFGAGLDIIEPCGFPLKSKDIKRVGLDYGALAPPVAHASWQAYQESPEAAHGRLILLTTKASASLYEIDFQTDDRLLIGQESAGAPEHIHDNADMRVTIPLAENARSLNMAVAGGIALSEARRQTGWHKR